MKRKGMLWALAGVLIFCGCSGGGGSSSSSTSSTSSSGNSNNNLPSGTPTLKFSPVDASNIQAIYPLGNLNPPGHTFPTDHIYFYHSDPANSVKNFYPVYAPVGGVVSFILKQPEGDYKIMIDVTSTFSYYLDHVLLDASISLGNTLQDGQVIGTTSDKSGAVDLGAVNTNVTLTGFINTARYPDQTIHTDSPLKYYEEPLKTTLYAKVQRDGSDKDGKIDFDTAGRLVGNWFLQGLATGESSYNYDSWTKHLAFVYDTQYPSLIRISIGGSLSMTGVYGVQDTATSPANVSVSSGKVSYKLYGFDPNNQGKNWPNQVGLLIVQMMDDNTIKVETFSGSAADTADYTSSALTYTR